MIEGEVRCLGGRILYYYMVLIFFIIFLRDLWLIVWVKGYWGGERGIFKYLRVIGNVLIEMIYFF